jgi:hypothetical protein
MGTASSCLLDDWHTEYRSVGYISRPNNVLGVSASRWRARGAGGRAEVVAAQVLPAARSPLTVATRS